MALTINFFKGIDVVESICTPVTTASRVVVVYKIKPVMNSRGLVGGKSIFSKKSFARFAYFTTHA